MTPDVSRAVATVKATLNLEPGPNLDALIAAAEQANTVDDLPQWALNVLSYAESRRDEHPS